MAAFTRIVLSQYPLSSSLEPYRFTMERPRNHHSAATRPTRVDRQLAPLKMVSRLLGHELHGQQSSRLTLSREEVLEIQTTLDIYIENITKASSGLGNLESVPDRSGSELEVQAVPARSN